MSLRVKPTELSEKSNVIIQAFLIRYKNSVDFTFTFAFILVGFLPLDEAKLQDAVLPSCTGRADGQTCGRKGGNKNKMAQVSLRNSPAMQLEDVPFKAIQGHLSRSQSKARI